MIAGFIAGVISAIVGVLVAISPDYTWWQGVIVWVVGTIILGLIFDAIIKK